MICYGRCGIFVDASEFLTQESKTSRYLTVKPMILIQEGIEILYNTLMSDRKRAVSARGHSGEENPVLTQRSVQIK